MSGRMRRWSDVPWRKPEGDEDNELEGKIPPDPRALFMALMDGTRLRPRTTTITPLMLADDDGEGFQVIMWRQSLEGLPADRISVAIPGLCQHFMCGDCTATLSLN